MLHLVFYVLLNPISHIYDNDTQMTFSNVSRLPPGESRSYPYSNKCSRKKTGFMICSEHDRSCA